MAEPTTVSVLSSETVSLSTTSAASALIGAANPGQPTRTELVRLCADTTCHVRIGLSDGVAITAVAEAAGTIRLPADAVEYLDVPAGAKITAILASGTGKLNIARMSKVT